MGLTKITSRILDSSGVTILGTIATGVWQGTAINQTYLVGQSGTNTGDETLARINALDVTELGTISSGVWNGTAINQTYLVGQSGTNTGDQTTISGNAGTVTNGVYTTGNQTIGGVKTFSSGITQSSGTLQIKNASGDGSGLKLYQAGSDVSTISNHYAGDIAFNTASTSQKMIIKNSGNVGIGTTSPAHKLSVNQNTYASGSDAPEAALGITIGDYWTTSAGAALTIKNAGHRGAVGHASGSPLFRADFNNATGMILDKNGHVGIGTASPVGRVDVRMNMSGQNWIPNGTSAKWGEVWDSAGTPGSKFNNSVFHLNTNRLGGIDGGVVGLAFSPGWQGHQNWGIYSWNNSGGTYTQGDLSFVNQINNGTIQERMRLTAGGAVTKPSQPAFSMRTNANLDVTGDVIIPFNTNGSFSPINCTFSSGRFTATTAGRYLFTFTASCVHLANHQYNAVYFKVNNNGQPQRFRGAAEGSTNDWFGINGATIIDLAASDYVELYTYSDISTAAFRLNAGETTWCGYLL